MNKIGNIFCIFLCCFSFATTIQAQSFLKKTLKVLDAVNEINKTNNTPKEQSSKHSNVQLNTTSPNGFRITAPFQDLTFKIKNCTATNSTVTIEITVKNQEKNQRFLFGGDDQRVRTIVVDDLDNSYDYEKIKISIGDKSPEVTQSELFPTQVPIKMYFYINEVDPSARMINMFALRVEGFDTPITFYNIPIERPVAIVSTGDNTPSNASALNDGQKDTQATSKLKKIIGNYNGVSRIKGELIFNRIN